MRLLDVERRWSIERWYRRTWMYDVKVYLHNRFVGKPHIINVRWLKPGEYSDRVEVLFHAIFQVLVDFIEEELGHDGWMYDKKEVAERLSHGEYVHPTNVEYVNASWWDRRQHRKEWAKRLGLATLDWYATLDGPDEEHPNVWQAEFGREAKKLYLWYTKERDERLDPFDEFDGPKHVNENGEVTDEFFAEKEEKIGEDVLFRMNPFTEEYRAHLKKCREIEEQHHVEDQTMLKRVIDLRRGMWT